MKLISDVTSLVKRTLAPRSDRWPRFVDLLGSKEPKKVVAQIRAGEHRVPTAARAGDPLTDGLPDVLLVYASQELDIDS